MRDEPAGDIFSFESVKETFCDCVVVTIVKPAHAQLKLPPNGSRFGAQYPGTAPGYCVGQQSPARVRRIGEQFMKNCQGGLALSI
jgi:hypothetical protein